MTVTDFDRKLAGALYIVEEALLIVKGLEERVLALEAGLGHLTTAVEALSQAGKLGQERDDIAAKRDGLLKTLIKNIDLRLQEIEELAL